MGEDGKKKRRRKRIPKDAQREFLIKWKEMSFWHCSWVQEIQLDVYHPQSYRMFLRKTDMDEPRRYDEEGEEEDQGSRRLKHHKGPKDPMQMYKRFYRYGIKPTWLQPNRVLNRRTVKDGTVQYLVKWTDLTYADSTWEDEDEEIPDLPNFIRDYEDLRYVCGADGRKKKKKEKGADEIKRKYSAPPDRASTDLDVKYKDNPSCKWLPDGLALHPYQLEGISWARYSWNQNTDIILADEMGLGKTIQTITFLYSLYKEGHCRGPFLVAVPLSTLINWEREFALWAPEFYVVSYVGDKDSRIVIRENELSFEDNAVRKGDKASRIKASTVKFHCLLTSYEMISMDAACLGSVQWEILVVDEAHRLKNNQSKFFKILAGYALNYKMLLTGTPLQNNLEELFYLLNFLTPNKFNDLDTFQTNFEDIGKEDQVRMLHELLGPHMLRRLKADVLKNMPSKTECIVRTNLAPQQKKVYKNILTRNFEALNSKGGAQVSLLNIMMELKKCANHPYLLPGPAEEAQLAPNGLFEITGMIKACGKLTLMSKMLRQLKAQGHRVLIFSQMTKMLDLLEDFLDGIGYKYERIDGGITGTLRQASIDRFNKPNSESFVFLLSTRAGGLGINLATGDTVIIYDSDWNPHNDIQAFSRAHRIGQKNKVLIYRFVTQNSVEERVAQVAKRKMMLNHLVIRPGIGTKDNKTLSKNEMDDILRFGTQDLFKNEDEDSTKDVDYTDEMVTALLRREDKEDDEGEEEESNKLLDDYFSGFKVAKYQLTEEEKIKEQKEAEKWAEHMDQGNVDQEYWDKLLRHHYEQHVEEESGKMGKGKRVRRQVQYFQLGQEEITNMGDDDEYAGDDGPNAGSDNEYLESNEPDGKRRPRYDRNAPKVMPAKFSKTTKDFEVFGFHSRQRRAYINLCMRYGLPPRDHFQERWIVRELSRKSDKEFRAYSHTFMTHLCEPSSDGSDKFMDGIPKENLPRQGVLNRIGVMLLIQKKVDEFKKVNGTWSIKELNPVNQPKEEPEAASAAESAAAVEEGEEAIGEKEVAKEEKEGDEVKTEEAATVEPKTEEKEDEKVDDKIDEKVDEDLPEVESGKKDTETMETEDAEAEEKNEEVEPEKPKKTFMFNIADGGFTELHTLWTTEEDAALNRHTKINEIWHRRHDYWLLAGMATHGYARWTDIQNDPRFAIINEPFRAMAAKQGNFQDMQNRFLGRRFKLLEQALVIEEQLRRSSYLNLHQDPYHQAMALTNRFAQLETITESHRQLPQCAAQGNKAAAHVLLKVLDQIEALLNEMKNDVVRLPTVLARVQPVSNRLGMTERTLLERLRAQNADKSAYPPFNQMPPGPFCSGVPLQIKNETTSMRP